MKTSKFLIFAALSVVPSLGWAADATCEITIEGERIVGPCNFQPHGGGSFEVRMNNGQDFDGSSRISLDVLRDSIGEIHSDIQNYGAAYRSEREPACWSSDTATICVWSDDDIEAKVSNQALNFSHPTDLPMVVLGRCHMGGCWWTRVEDIEIIGEGSYAVPGKRIRIKASALDLEARFEDGYDRLIAEATPVHPDWKGPFYQEFFCSMVRPAFLNNEDEWMVLSPAIVGGASEGITNKYLTVCHARDYSGDPYIGGQELGYHVETPGDFETMSFAELISP